MNKFILYGYSAHESTYFDTEKEFMEYLRNKGLSTDKYSKLEYLSEYKSRRDVIKVTSNKGHVSYYTAIDDDGYAIYNARRSKKENEAVWEFNYGNIRGIYSAFRKRGVKFQKDVYREIDKYYANVLGWNDLNEHHFEVKAVPLNMPYILSREKSKEFLEQKPTKSKVKSKLLELFSKNIRKKK